MIYVVTSAEKANIVSTHHRMTMRPNSNLVRFRKPFHAVFVLEPISERPSQVMQ